MMSLAGRRLLNAYAERVRNSRWKSPNRDGRANRRVRLRRRHFRETFRHSGIHLQVRTETGVLVLPVVVNRERVRYYRIPCTFRVRRMNAVRREIPRSEYMSVYNRRELTRREIHKAYLSGLRTLRVRHFRRANRRTHVRRDELPDDFPEIHVLKRLLLRRLRRKRHNLREYHADQGHALREPDNQRWEMAQTERVPRIRKRETHTYRNWKYPIVRR